MSNETTMNGPATISETPAAIVQAVDHAPATNVDASSGRNIEVLRGMVGRFRVGDIVPKFELMSVGSIPTLIEMGSIRLTDAPVNIEILPQPEVQSQSTVDAIIENKSLRDEIAVLTEAKKGFEARYQDAQNQITALKAEVGPKVIEVDRLSGLLAGARADVADLEAEVKLLKEENQRLTAELKAKEQTVNPKPK